MTSELRLAGFGPAAHTSRKICKAELDIKWVIRSVRRAPAATGKGGEKRTRKKERTCKAQKGFQGEGERHEAIRTSRMKEDRANLKF